MLERLKPRKGAAPVSVAELHRQEAVVDAGVKAVAEERSGLEAALPALTAHDPVTAAAALKRLEEISVELPIKQRTLSLIRSAITEAEKREAREDLEKDVERQRLASRKLSRNLESRYTAALEQFLGVIEEIDADRRAASTLSPVAYAAGLGSVSGAEYELRKGLPLAITNTFVSVVSGLELRRWDGRRAYPK